MTTSGIIHGPALVHGKALIEGRAIFEGAALLQGAVHTRLSFSGALTVEKGSAGPHFTLVVINPPVGVSYAFAEAVSGDPDSVSTVSTDEVTISGAVGIHLVTYTATPSDSPTHATLTESLTITIQDTIAPVLTLPTDTKTGQTTATLTVTTDTGEGTLYTVVTTSATPPSAAQVIAGKDNAGVAAAFANSVAVASTGLKTVSATGLTAATAYTTFFVQKDASNNVSLVSAADGFTTDSNSDAAETTAFLARTSGLDATHTNAYKALINGLVTDGVFAKLDALWVLGTQDSTTAKLNLVSTSFTLSPQNAPTFTADRGYNGDGFISFLDTTLNPSTAGGLFTRNSAHISSWVLTNRATGDHDSIGSYDGTNITAINPFFSSSVNGAVNVSPGGNIGTATADSTGMVVANRSDSTHSQLYKNGSSVGSDNVSASEALANLSLYICGRNQGVSFSSPSSDVIFMASAGASLDATDASNLYSRANTFKTAVGA